MRDSARPFQLHAGYVLFWSFLTPVFYWRELGGMFHGAKPEVTEQHPTVLPALDLLPPLESTGKNSDVV